MNRKNFISLFLKGMAMGGANVIPGVSGGTVAFITNIYEELINSIKSFDFKAIQLLLKFEFKTLLEHLNFKFLLPVFLGVAVSILSLAKLLEFVFCRYETLTLASFFGLILASVYLVGKQIKQWNLVSVFALVIGTAVAMSISFFNPAQANDNVFFLFVCGMVAISSMILPGLSGSYILLIMGNYLLVLGAITGLNFGILLPFAFGCGIGLIFFSHLLAFVFKRWHDETVSVLTGFVFGSLLIIWPWKTTTYLTNSAGDFINKKQDIVTDLCKDGVVLNYARKLPEMNGEMAFAIALILIGAISVIALERLGEGKPEKST